MLKRLYPYRFEVFFFSQIAILFGSLIVPSIVFETYLSPVLFLINLFAGIVLLSKQKKTMWFLVALLVLSAVILGSELIETVNENLVGPIKMLTYFLFYIVVTVEIIKQVWQAKKVSKNVIFGLVSGYISLGLIGFFICLSIEMVYPNSFSGLIDGISITENLIYYSYITLLTIGYGDILPNSALAHKAAILIGLIGQIYLVVITAIVVGKYINQLSIKNDKN
ncbi:ion channel [Seonamhaeicola maritimus]|uniref:Two pore domain potassium channel family protein n=1 Tax=Seonamhaeicola maritimus TaxID=2591822 RepID=A0A5C7GL64_9FLAO|nr:ion channel [Seonamhaeicola maritimus]TXG39226.1 two pore domain potassium channel family protein [Seonamhaeicola maritimus]